MKTALKLAMIASVVGCGSDHKGKSNTNPSFLTIVDKNKGLSLAEGGSAVDGMFIGTFRFDAMSYFESNDQYNTLKIGSSDAESCSIPFLKADSSVDVSFCEGFYLEYKAANNLFSVDFLVSTMNAVGVVSEGMAYIKNDTRIWSPQANAEVKNLPLQTVEEAPSVIKVVYARKDWFPVPFTVESTTEDWCITNNITTSIVLTEKQLNMISQFVSCPETRSIQDSRVNVLYKGTVSVVPMDLALIDVSALTANSDSVASELPESVRIARKKADIQMQEFQDQQAKEAELRAQEQQQQQLRYQQHQLQQQLAARLNSRYACPMDDNVWSIVNGGSCKKANFQDANAVCPDALIKDGKSYQWATATVDGVVVQGYCTATVAPVVGLGLAEGSDALPLAQAKFVMELDFSNLLTADSKLNGANSSFQFANVNGAPFGTSMTVIRK